ncbi:hypothetical protein PQD13_gp13 [Gordonia phage Clawz]|uniref:Uncharacterized protein n=1 Tax=Gordonia phage Clawz TaxID=2743910 RepID=A0AAE7K657_9CAUD|nr:hypothetical protein PQD13_gp13 [Gordonia phage Clawz]QKY79925.1 hypothetical protein SEA_CLAWZ_13 [Gordonia phage Clawz]
MTDETNEPEVGFTENRAYALAEAAAGNASVMYIPPRPEPVWLSGTGSLQREYQKHHRRSLAELQRLGLIEMQPGIQNGAPSEFMESPLQPRKVTPTELGWNTLARWLANDPRSEFEDQPFSFGDPTSGEEYRDVRQVGEYEGDEPTTVAIVSNGVYEIWLPGADDEKARTLAAILNKTMED